jgi:F-type H+-transporting ATPase subunit b
MLIDWRTVAAELINFLLLVWLLNRFLFKPTMAVVKERDEKVRSELEGAARQQEEARVERGVLALEKDALAKEKNTLLKSAISEAQQEKERLLRDAHNEYTSLRETLHSHVEEDKKRLFSELRESIENEAFHLARTTLKSVSSASLEEQMIAQFAQKARQMDADAKQKLLFDLTHSLYAVTFKTAFEVPSLSRTLLEDTFKDFFGHPVICTFEQDPSLIGGVEMVTSGHTLSWNLSSSLLSIREAV